MQLMYFKISQCKFISVETAQILILVWLKSLVCETGGLVFRLRLCSRKPCFMFDFICGEFLSPSKHCSTCDQVSLRHVLLGIRDMLKHADPLFSGKNCTKHIPLLPVPLVFSEQRTHRGPAVKMEIVLMLCSEMCDGAEGARGVNARSSCVRDDLIHRILIESLRGRRELQMKCTAVCFHLRCLLEHINIAPVDLCLRF